MSIRFEKVDFEYSPNTPFAFKALQEIDLELVKGKMTAVIGATGSGKTTLVQHLNALLLPTKGKVMVDEFTIEAGKKFTDVKKLRKKVGLVFQFSEYQLFEETVLKDIAFGPKNFGVSPEEAEATAARCIELVGLKKEYLEKSPLEMSGGQKRRVAIAGILAMHPEVLVLDEPTAGLDPQGATQMMELFRKINREHGITVLIVTHNMDHVLEYCDDVVVLEKGHLKMHVDVEKFFESDDFMLEANINPPAIIRFKRMLMERGLEVPADILDNDALVKYLAGRKRK